MAPAASGCYAAGPDRRLLEMPSMPAPLLYRQRIETALVDGLGPRGLPRAELEARLARLAPALQELRNAYADRSLPLLRIAEETADIEAAEAALAKLSAGARTVVFLGTGGSSLGGQTLAQLAGWNLPGSAGKPSKDRPRTRFYDNLDPDTLGAALADLDLASTRFVVISKSGGTPETLTQALAVIAALQEAGLGPRLPELLLGLTEPAVAGRANGLRSLLEGLGAPVLEHHPGIGGRFSVLTNVGLLPAMARGLDVRAVRAGARSVLEAMLAAPSTADFAPAVGAALSIALAEAQDVTVHVMMPYADRLGRLAAWFSQLWAESLGKDGKGTTPVACLGPLDQHSQLQLFMDGPRRHLMTILRTDTRGEGPRIPPGLAEAAGLAMMAGLSVGDLVAAQAEAVPEALVRAGRPVRVFDIERIDEAAVGALLMHFMLETILAGRLLGIDPFDQPAVELAKVLTRERLASSR
jgi:glucose-6-phosphate isomerase